MSIKNLIEAIEAGDATEINKLFDKLMAEKLAEAIEEKKVEIAESFLVSDESLEEAYTASGTLHHGGVSHKFKVKYDDFPDHEDVQKQNPHLKKHHVDAIMNHFDEHGDDDMTDTHSTHTGSEVHVKHNTGSMDESLIEEFEQLDELSKKTLGNYVLSNVASTASLHKAKGENEVAKQKAMDLDYGSDRNASKHMEPVRSALNKSGKAIDHKLSKRQFGVYRAVRNLTKEQVEEFLQSEDFQALDELSKTTLGSYVKKAVIDRVKRTKREHELDVKNDQLSNAMHNIDDRDARDAIHVARSKVWDQRAKKR